MFPYEYQTQEKRWFWLYYHLAHTVESDTVIGNIVYLVKENPPLMFKECKQQQQKRKKTSTLMGETCVYLYFNGYIWFVLS